MSHVLKIFTNPDAGDKKPESVQDETTEEEEESEYEYEYETEDSEDECHVEIEEVCDPAGCQGLETTDMYDITEAEGDSDNEQLDQEGLVEENELIKNLSSFNIARQNDSIGSGKVVESLPNSLEKQDEVHEQQQQQEKVVEEEEEEYQKKQQQQQQLQEKEHEQQQQEKVQVQDQQKQQEQQQLQHLQEEEDHEGVKQHQDIEQQHQDQQKQDQQKQEVESQVENNAEIEQQQANESLEVIDEQIDEKDIDEKIDETIDSLKNEESCSEESTVTLKQPEMSRENQLLLLQFPVGPKIPPFVESSEPCKFHENPTVWIEWLVEEVKIYREKKDKEKKEKKKQVEEEAEKERLIQEEKERMEAESKRLERERINAERFEQELEIEFEAERIAKEQEEKERLVKEEEEKVRSATEEEEKGTLSKDQEDQEKESEHENKDTSDEIVIEADEVIKDEPSDGLEKEAAEEEDEGEWEWEDEEEVEAEAVTAEAVEQDKKLESIEPLTVPTEIKIEDTTTEAIEDNAKVQEADQDTSTPNQKETKVAKEISETKIEIVINGSHEESAKVNHENKADADPMDVLERIKQFKQSKAYKERHSSTEETGSGSVGAAPFMRQFSNPEHGGRRSRPASLVGDNSLDDMLVRIKKLREERLQILQDMSLIKSAFEQDEVTSEDKDDTISSTDNGIFHETSSATTGLSTPTSWDDTASLDQTRSRLDSMDSGISGNTVSIRKKTKRRMPWEEAAATEQVCCFICSSPLGRLNKAASVHMGLEDGEPICSDAIHLTDRSRRKIKNIALAKKLDLRSKYELCETLDLDFTVEDSQDVSSQEVLDRVEHFLDDIELQKERDKEEFESIRMGAIDAIFAAEFANPTLEPDTPLDDSLEDDSKDITETVVEQNAFEKSTTEDDSSKPEQALNGDQGTLSEARSILLQSIHQGKQLKRAITDDKSEPVEAGKVLHKHIAPRAFTRSHRELMQSIDGKVDKNKLNKVKVNDRSAPYIPADIEIYFYSGPNADKKAAPPPVSRPANETSPIERYADFGSDVTR